MHVPKAYLDQVGGVDRIYLGEGGGTQCLLRNIYIYSGHDVPDFANWAVQYMPHVSLCVITLYV